MPFENIEEAIQRHPNLKRYSEKAQNAWLSAFNNAFEKNDEGTSFAIAYSVANKIDNIKKANKIDLVKMIENLVKELS